MKPARPAARPPGDIAPGTGTPPTSRFVARRCAGTAGFRAGGLAVGVDTPSFAPGRRCFDGADIPVVLLHPPPCSRGRASMSSLHAVHPARPWPLGEARGHRHVRILDWKSELARYRRDVSAKVEALELGPHVEFRGVAYGHATTLRGGRRRRLPDRRRTVRARPPRGDELRAPGGRVSASGGIPETVEDGVTGHMVPPGDADAPRRLSADRYLDAHLRRYAGAEAVGPVPS